MSDTSESDDESGKTRKHFHQLTTAGVRYRLGDLGDEFDDGDSTVVPDASSFETSEATVRGLSTYEAVSSPACPTIPSQPLSDDPDYSGFSPQRSSTQLSFFGDMPSFPNLSFPSDAAENSFCLQNRSIAENPEELPMESSFSYHEMDTGSDSDIESIYQDCEGHPDLLSDEECLYSSDDDFFDDFDDFDLVNESVRSAAASVISVDNLENANLTVANSTEASTAMSDSFCSSSSDKVQSEIERIMELLRDWALRNAITLAALTDLSKTLKQTHVCFKDLPSQARTILKTNVQISASDCPSGEYVHIGLKKQLDFILSIIPYGVTVLSLMFNLDGLPIFKKSKSSLWPILMAVPNTEELENKVFPVGLCYGPGKPADLRSFLQPFITEYLELFSSNVLKKNGNPVRIEILGFPCDTPARSFILGTKGHGGFFSCFRCKIKGENFQIIEKGVLKGTKRIFWEIDAPSRTDPEFRNFTDKEFQLRETPLLDLPGLNFTLSFPLDYMHSTCLGVMRMFLILWMSSASPRQLLPRQRAAMDEKLEECYPFLSSMDFPRKPRDLKQVATWKATQARVFLLYIGMVVLKGILDDEKYMHFLQLSLGMRIFLGPSLCSKLNFRRYAAGLLRCFVSSTRNLYGKQFMTPNLHSLIHIPEDVAYFIDSFKNFSLNFLSCFPFENCMQFFKRYTKSYARVAIQLGRRMGELFASTFWKAFYTSQSATNEIILQEEYKYGPFPAMLKGKAYRRAIFRKFTLTTDTPESTCGLKTGEIVIAQNFILDPKTKEKYIVGKKFCKVSEFFSKPFWDSRLFNIYDVSRISKKVYAWPLSSVDMKFVRLPLEKSYVVIPLLHSDLTPSSL